MRHLRIRRCESLTSTSHQKNDFSSKASRFEMNRLCRPTVITSRSDITVEAEIDCGTIVNVEIQCVDSGDLGSRSIVYASKLIA